MRKQHQLITSTFMKDQMKALVVWRECSRFFILTAVCLSPAYFVQPYIPQLAQLL
ncbi:hypothetical protein BDW74DRAFT_144132, partial [Aspergillus multicolor]|uniref:uncharacterized protein n=1 Tax=Aspergillus multicolor TaxID=41759 RepID=UPI003CCDD93C